MTEPMMIPETTVQVDYHVSCLWVDYLIVYSLISYKLERQLIWYKLDLRTEERKKEDYIITKKRWSVYHIKSLLEGGRKVSKEKRHAIKVRKG